MSNKDTTKSVTIRPYDWQAKKIKRLAEIFTAGDVAFDMSDTGTGKTITGLGLLGTLDRQALIVCPKKVHSSWLNTAKEMGFSDNVLGVVNAERLQYKNDWFTCTGWKKDLRTKDWAAQGSKWHVPKGTMIIMDEVHRGCSGPKTKTTNIMALTLAQKIPVLAMSATMADSPLKMRFLGYLAKLHQYNVPSFYGWCRRNGCFSIEGVRGLHFPKGPKGQTCMQKIHTAIQDISVRSRIDDIEGFPESIIQANLYDLDAQSLKALIKTYEELAAIKRSTNELTKMLRSRQEAEMIKIPLFAELVVDALEEGAAPVVFVNFRESLFKMQQLLGAMNIKMGRVIGGEDADADIAAFGEDRLDAMGCMTQGGFGINLHAIAGRRPRKSYISPSFNAVDMCQNLGRIHRINGSKVIQTFVLVAGTIEEKVHRAILGKLKNIKSLNGDDLNAL